MGLSKLITFQHKDLQNKTHKPYLIETPKGWTLNQNNIEFNTLSIQPPTDADVYLIIREKYTYQWRNEHQDFTAN